MTTPKTVLLVEDDEDDQFFFIEALGEIENASLYHVANNGKEALDKLESSVIHPDLIFMDINMPVMNGIDCLTAIIRNPKLSDIPVVILTTDTGIRELVCELGAKAFIKKPNSGTRLRIQLKEMINLDFFMDAGHIPNQTFKSGFQN